MASPTAMEEDIPVIDEDMQSRQMAVYGRESMQKLRKASVLISGLNGLGAEIAKNVILSNPMAVSAAARVQPPKPARPVWRLTPATVFRRRSASRR